MQCTVLEISRNIPLWKMLEWYLYVRDSSNNFCNSLQGNEYC